MTQSKTDIVVIGGSAGSLQPMMTLVGSLDPSFQGSIFVVMHSSPISRHRVSTVLRTACVLPVQDVEDGMPILPGRIYVAPNDRHMILGPNHVHLRRGPTENGFRPAIDPLFRSAALAHSTRAIGIVLSGTLDDGSSGLRAIRRCGGTAIVQNFDEADFPDMPRNAHDTAGADHVLEVAEIARKLHGLVERDASESVDAPDDIRIEVLIAGLEEATMRNEERLGELSPYSCPDCSGNLWRIEDGALVRFRCHTGHAYTSETLSELQEQALERRLYEVLRGQRERAALLKQMADTGGPRTRESLERRAARYEEDAQLVERVLRNGEWPDVERARDERSLEDAVPAE